MVDLDLSEGSVYGFCRKFGGASETSIRHLEEKLLIQNVVARDATTVTVDGEQNYIRNFSVGDTVVYHAMNSKSIEALKGLDFLDWYTGILVHDHETPYITLEQTMQNYTSSAICVKIQRKQETSGQMK